MKIQYIWGGQSIADPWHRVWDHCRAEKLAIVNHMAFHMSLLKTALKITRKSGTLEAKYNASNKKC